MSTSDKVNRADNLDEQRIAMLCEHRASLEVARLAICRDRDKVILTIAGGALAVSVTFLERVFTNMSAWSTVLLILGWFLEVAAVSIVLRSLHCSEAALAHERERTDCMLSGDGRDPGWENHQAKKTDSNNGLASVLAVVGVVLILIQAVVSLLAARESQQRDRSVSPAPKVATSFRR